MRRRNGSQLISVKVQEEKRLEEKYDDIFYVYSEDKTRVSKKQARKRWKKLKNPSDQICFPNMVTSESGEVNSLLKIIKLMQVVVKIGVKGY